MIGFVLDMIHEIALSVILYLEPSSVIIDARG